ncbi:MAG: hypothetical protein IPM98_09700 [Lewinellaceae bacterium]|nr:hypothetical protein [Lewinellaceae bacterium]
MVAKKIYAAYFSLFFLMLFVAVQGLGQISIKPKTIFEHLTPQEGTEITLETDLTTIMVNRYSTDYLPAMLTLADGQSFVVKVQPKGKFRRKTAEVPPLKIKFTKKMLLEQGLDTLNEVRLVLPCFDNGRGDRLLIKEYLIYRMFERLTNNCVRARLVQVTLRDNHVEKSSKKMFGLLVEDNEETAARLKGIQIEQYGMPYDSTVIEQAALVAIFQYMIGNTDWDVPMMRNVRLIRPDDSRVLVVPYDFDFSGLVAAPYASPSSESGLMTVRDRFLMANGIPREALRQAVQTLKSAQRDLYDLCNSKHLNRETSTEMARYLDSFFKSIDKNFDVPARASVVASD